MELSAVEIRVLGSLVEKETTTPDNYPLSTNALLAACNQLSSRDPIVAYDEGIVTPALISLRERGLVRTTRGEGSRVYKHAHRLRDALGLDAAGLAVLSVLMLRGPQTPGEVRARSERQHGLGSLEEAEAVLGRLVQEGLARQLERQPGRKEARFEHLLAAAETRPPSATPLPSLEEPAGGSRSLATELAVLRDDLAAVRARLDALEARIEAAEPPR